MEAAPTVGAAKSNNSNCIAMKRTHKEEKLLLMGTLEDLAQAEHELAENNDFDDFDEFNY